MGKHTRSAGDRAGAVRGADHQLDRAVSDGFLTPAGRDHLLTVTRKLHPGSPALDVPTRSREGAALDVAERALRIIASMAYEDVVQEHACKALNRVREIMTA